uniref:RNA dependent RNA polymerase n=2 Tax=unclassified Caudoviricetes TaxID=2788787 RepID=A0A8S5PLC3_9CAUD|nr:MAG TPA: RNA dependent RNA polymerase [Siphoviridae sp. ctOSJ35]DAE15977.1 MAG TPA: RNA dependent RNA polymerase [Siphoviridae sp. ctIOF8]
MSKIDLFYTLKLNTSDIYEQIAKNGCVETDFKTAKNAGWVVALGDNQLLRFIRQIKDKPFDKEKVQTLYDRRNILKQDKSSKKNAREITKIQNEINELLFVPDLVTVRTDTTQKDYKQLCKTGFSVKFKVNETECVTKYKRLCAGAGQLRKNSANFVNAEIYDQLLNIMLCGLDAKSIGKINLAKFGAYLALSTSATRVVKTPRICVVDDYEYPLKDQVVDWIFKNEKGEDDIRTEKIDFTMNAFDGAGMVCPEMAERWQQDLELDYLPSSFIVRAAWFKGLCSIFDFRRFAHEIAHKDTITDIYGVTYNIDEIDVIAGSSMFKLHKCYPNFQVYQSYFKRYGHVFGVARVSKKVSNQLSTLNYQYIQSNDFTEESIKNLANPTIDWLQKVMSCDPLYASLMMIGCHDRDTLEQIENSLESPIAKCLLYNTDILNDSYAKSKLMRLVRKKIDQAKIGKVYVEGSYDFLIPDLYAMCEHAFGMEVHGLLPPKCMYSKRWVDKGAKIVSTQRSPLVAPAENQLLNVYSDDKCKDWFRYLEWGNIYSIWDLTIISQSDADFDKY